MGQITYDMWHDTWYVTQSSNLNYYLSQKGDDDDDDEDMMKWYDDMWFLFYLKRKTIPYIHFLRFISTLGFAIQINVFFFIV